MDISFNCDQCGQQIVVDEAGAGMLVQCPKCGEQITVPTPTASTNRSPTKSADSALLRETFSDKSESIEQRWSRVLELAPSRKINAGERGRALMAIQTDELEGRNDPLVRQSLAALRLVQANAAVGVSLDRYSASIADAWLAIDDLVARDSQYPVCIAWLVSAFGNYRNALNLWGQATRNTTQFMGGGFGVSGFLIGAAISTGLNAMMDVADGERASSVAASIHEDWSFAAAKIEMLRQALAQPAGTSGKQPVRVNFDRKRLLDSSW
jgi:predicted Zn finger-like uncharacterized protein